MSVDWRTLQSAPGGVFWAIRHYCITISERANSALTQGTETVWQCVHIITLSGVNTEVLCRIFSVDASASIAQEMYKF